MELKQNGKAYYSTDNDNKIRLFSIEYTILDQDYNKQSFIFNMVGKSVSSCIDELEKLVKRRIVDIRYKVIPLVIDKISNEILQEIKHKYKDDILKQVKSELHNFTLNAK